MAPGCSTVWPYAVANTHPCRHLGSAFATWWDRLFFFCSYPSTFSHQPQRWCSVALVAPGRHREQTTITHHPSSVGPLQDQGATHGRNRWTADLHGNLSSFARTVVLCETTRCSLLLVLWSWKPNKLNFATTGNGRRRETRPGNIKCIQYSRTKKHLVGTWWETNKQNKPSIFLLI